MRRRRMEDRWGVWKTDGGSMEHGRREYGRSVEVKAGSKLDGQQVASDVYQDSLASFALRCSVK